MQDIPAGLPDWITGLIDTPAGPVPIVSTRLNSKDRFGALKVRLGINRMHYSIYPGLFATGNPTPDSPVFVSANYCLSFDTLRSHLNGIDAWIVVLDTRGINVWCAAGKGTFGTEEIIQRIRSLRLSEIVSHKKLILPQLGAPGVRAHDVTKRCGFRVVYGPVRASDIPAFMEAGMKATPEMRRVQFPLRDRAVLIPLELIMAGKYALYIAAALFLLSGFGEGFYSIQRAAEYGIMNGAILLLSCIAGAVFTPLLLPWLPGRSFSAKGVWVGSAAVFILLMISRAYPGIIDNGVTLAGWIFIIPAITGFIGMNFTGASTYTSLSGVVKEMRIAMLLQGAAALVGATLWITGRFI
ncbi:hypothetical protein ES708_09238 [subsurface metagenome]